MCIIIVSCSTGINALVVPDRSGEIEEVWPLCLGAGRIIMQVQAAVASLLSRPDLASKKEGV